MDDNNKKSGGLYRHMKGLYEIFEEKTKKIVDMISAGNLRGCLGVSRNITMYSAISDFDDGILISEIFENIFSEIGPLFEMHEIDEKDKQRFLDELKSQIVKIPANLNSKHKDEKELYLILREMRSLTTKLQVMTWEKAKRKPKNEDKK